MNANAHQLDLRYRGRVISILAAQTAVGWNWAAMIDSRPAIECEGEPLPSAEMALYDGIASVEDLIDSGDDYSTRGSASSWIT
jgi:hypothetical protein